jgi:hypothetical protein
MQSHENQMNLKGSVASLDSTAQTGQANGGWLARGGLSKGNMRWLTRNSPVGFWMKRFLCNLGLIAMLVVAEQPDIIIIKLYRYQIWDMKWEQGFPSL